MKFSTNSTKVPVEGPIFCETTLGCTTLERQTSRLGSDVFPLSPSARAQTSPFACESRDSYQEPVRKIPKRGRRRVSSLPSNSDSQQGTASRKHFPPRDIMLAVFRNAGTASEFVTHPETSSLPLPQASTPAQQLHLRAASSPELTRRGLP